jgi:hypothetical protein
MSNLTREIDSEVVKITAFVEDRLAKDKLLIPTFQREFVWQPDNILKLWDSMFRFYPIGSILYWVTETYLHTHRKLGGFEFPHDEDSVKKFKEWSYILDGQQRATSLLVSILGGKGKIKEDEAFDYTLYFDATNASFFFANELEQRKAKVNPAFLIRLKDVPRWTFEFYGKIASEQGFTQEIGHNISQLDRIFKDYKLVLIKVQGVDVEEVCEIFERVNQEGKKLDPVDIIVARTYRNENPEKGTKMFYLRDNLHQIREVLKSEGSQFQELGDLSIIQMVATCLRKEESGKRKSFGITPRALDNLTTKDLEDNWDKCQKTIFETIKFLSDLGIHGPGMLPFGYLMFPLCHYWHNNKAPDGHYAKQWFWSTAFGLEDFRRADQVYSYCTDFFDRLELGEKPPIPEITISRSRLVQSRYYYRSALSLAVLSFLAHQNPLDFADYKAPVLDNVYFILSQAPNLHHVYPRDFLQNVRGLPDDANIDSPMNICYLRAKTNIKISNKNPLDYFREFENSPYFDEILESHLIPREFVKRDKFTPQDYRDFLYARAELLCQRLQTELPDVRINIV